MRPGRRLRILAASVVLALGLAPLVHAQTSTDAAAAPYVLAATARPASGSSGSLAGVVSPRVSANLGFPILGRLLSREASAGSMVQEGDVLGSIEATALVAGVEAARAELRAAQAQLENASSAHERQLALAGRGIVPQSVVEATEAQQATARARTAAATAALAQAEDQLANATLVAPFDGVVVAVAGEVGQVIVPGTAVITLARPDLRDAVVDLPERTVSGLAAGTAATIRLELDPSITARGQVRDIAPSADPSTRLYRVRIGFDAPAPAFRFGTNISVSFAGMQNALPLEVPASAVFRTDEGSFVWVVDPAGSRVTRRAVRLGETVEGRVIVVEGLAAGESVVVAGVGLLSEGQSVRVYAEGRR